MRKICDYINLNGNLDYETLQ